MDITLAPMPNAHTNTFVVVVNGEVVTDNMNYAEARRAQGRLGGTIGTRG